MASSGWSCAMCTFINTQDNAKSCTICGSPKSVGSLPTVPIENTFDLQYRELEKQWNNKQENKNIKLLTPKPEFTDDICPTILSAQYGYYKNEHKTDSKENKQDQNVNDEDDCEQEGCIIDQNFNAIEDYKLNDKDFSEWSINKIMKTIKLDNFFKNNSKQFNPNTPMWKFLKKNYPKNNEYIDDYDHLKRTAIRKVNKLKYCDPNGELISHMSFDEISAITLYTADHIFKPLNKSLRNGQVHWAPFCAPLVTGLRKLPFAWKTTYRGQTWQAAKVLNTYKPGRIIRYDGFSSSSTNIERAKNFGVKSGKQGYILEIESGYHGRSIEKFSVFENEGEILFSVSSHFMIIDRYKKDVCGINMEIIKMKELPLPWNSKTVLWVDDNPENNKNLMEKIEKKGVMIVPRISTKEGLEFLDFMNHAFRESFDEFRIISDMYRIENDIEFDENGQQKIETKKDKIAGITLIEELRKRKYNNTVVIFTSSSKVDIVIKQCKKKGIYDPKLVIVTGESNRVEKFASFGV